MSILVREKGADGSLGPYTLLSKGADDVMFEKLRPDGDKSAEDDVTRHLAHFASLGLRTLVLAKKTLTDAKAVEWLERYLIEQTSSLALVIVSHDREFLDRVCTKIVNTEQGIAASYNGNYRTFLAQKAEQDALQMK